jgi:MoxR-like ATPase
MKYRGNGLPPDNNSTNRFAYLADAELVDAVNVALELKRPLLVKGQPGCGKTLLAESVAHELGIAPSNVFRWYIKSTSRAKDGLYKIDMVRRLQDAQLKNKLAQFLSPYISFGELGNAIKADGQSLLLIDEIDKADIDFPNDLLRELDKMEFEIEEIDDRELDKLSKEDGSEEWKRTYRADPEAPPIIVITSNDEKELSDAFLRRCLFVYIEFPKEERLREIVKSKFSGLKSEEELLIDQAVARLVEFREIGELRKSPSTSELIDWVTVLLRWKVTADRLAKDKRLIDLPHWQTVFKHERDVNLMKDPGKENRKQ